MRVIGDGVGSCSVVSPKSIPHRGRAALHLHVMLQFAYYPYPICLAGLPFAISTCHFAICRAIYLRLLRNDIRAKPHR